MATFCRIVYDGAQRKLVDEYNPDGSRLGKLNVKYADKFVIDGVGNRRLIQAQNHALNDNQMTENNRIVIDPEICHGSPSVRGLRYSVTMILELLASEMSHSQILADYADPEEGDIRACLQFAAHLSDVKSFVKTGSSSR